MRILGRIGWAAAALVAAFVLAFLILSLDSLVAGTVLVVLLAPIVWTFGRRALESEAQRQRRIAESKAAALRKLKAEQGLPGHVAGPL